LLDDYHPRQRSTFALTLYRHSCDVVAVPRRRGRNGTSTGNGKEIGEDVSQLGNTENGSSSSSTGTRDGNKGEVDDTLEPVKKRIAVDFWDTAGQERFASMHPSYYHKAHACILVFDVTRKVTYQNLQNWYKELRIYCETIPCICIANKIDVDLNVTSKAFAFPKTHNLPFYFVSAADGTNVVKIFEETVNLAWQYRCSGEKDFVSEVLELLDEKSLGAFGRALYGPASPPSGNGASDETKRVISKGGEEDGGGDKDSFDVKRKL
jgi:Rab-like protein 2